MFKRLLIIFLVLLLLLPSFSVASDEEVSLSDTLQGFTALPGGLQTGGQPTLNPQEPLGIETEPDKLRVTENGCLFLIRSCKSTAMIRASSCKTPNIFLKKIP
jgi:hypothetical protein